MKITILFATILLLFTACDKDGITIDKNQNQNEFIDPRDGNAYPTITINGVRWLASNLRYIDLGGNGDTLSTSGDNPPFYGQYYDVNRITRVCPDGWHISTDEEWTDLEEYILGRPLNASDSVGSLGRIMRGNYANKLKSNDTDWGNEGTNEYNLDIKAGGVSTSASPIPRTGTLAIFTTPPANAINSSSNYFVYREFRIGDEGIYRLNGNTSNILKTSCRCIEN